MKGVKTGGRQKGSKNKIKFQEEMIVTREEIVASAAEARMTPLEYMLAIMRDPNVEQRRRDAMAIAAGPYVHAKLSSIEQKTESTVEQTITVKQDAADEIARRLARLRERGDAEESPSRH